MVTWLDNVTGFGKVKVEPVEWLTLEFLLFNLREIDQEEIACNIDSENPLEWAAWIWRHIAHKGCGWVARLNGRPAAVLGIFQNFPGNWQVYSFGTDQYPRVVVFLRDYMDAAVKYGLDNGMHRLECRSISSHKDAHGLLRLRGFTPEAILRQFGRRRQEYILFRRIWGADHDEIHCQPFNLDMLGDADRVQGRATGTAERLPAL